MRITPELFAAYLQCPTKCWLKSTGERGAGNAYAEWVQAQDEAYRAAGTERLRSTMASGDYATSPPANTLKEANWRLAFDVPAQTETLETRIQAVERQPSEGRGRPAQFIPVRFISRNKLTKEDKLLLGFDALVLSETVGREVSIGKIIHGDDDSTLKVKASGLAGQVRKTTDQIATLLSNTSTPDLILNRHCPDCEFRDRCRQKAIEKDDLSLLGGMSEKERKKLNGEGIFTVTQLSYTFRPRRRPKHLKDRREKYHHALKALAIRERKIHIIGSPELKIEGTPVYFDVESLPDREFYYLIGVRVQTPTGAVHHSFWADCFEDERKTWTDFLNLLSTIQNPVLIYYGSFEGIFLRTMRERYGPPPEESSAAKAIETTINLVSFLFAQIYFPTHSNGLKDLAGWLDCKWTSPNASGTQSIIWRIDWDRSGEPSLKENLLTYNSEDCQALQVLTEALVQLCCTDHRSDLEKGDDPTAVLAEGRLAKNTLFGRFTSPISDFEVINKAARWDFQREKVYIRTDKTLKHAMPKKKVRVKRALPVNKTINCEIPRACPFCGGKPDKRLDPGTSTQYDLRFSRFGLRRWVVKYRFRYCRCTSCKKRFGKPAEFWPHSTFGRNAIAFMIYEMIDLCVPQNTTARTINRLFGLQISDSTLNNLKASAAEYYAETRQNILTQMLKGNLIHADETPITLSHTRGYVWVFASMHAVVYFYADTREGELLREKLQGFQGVLVSDFYAAYESLACPQQKCLLHLMRDLNKALLDAPFDEELKRISLAFGDLLRNIVETIDRWGLKRRFLHKHLADVDRFYRKTVGADYNSAAALKCKERFEKNKQSLFTFLRHDGIPWNNNNAEHAIKAFTRLRRIIEGRSDPKAFDDYLVLLSICQTCKYRGLDFLDFLRSGEKDIEVFAQKQPGRRKRGIADTKNQEKESRDALDGHAVSVKQQD